jgi:thymidylate kinase
MIDFSYSAPTDDIHNRFHIYLSQKLVKRSIICGLDGSGKHSAVTELSKILCQKGYNVVTISYPYDNSKSGHLLRQMLRSEYDWLDFTFDERIALYAINRAETISIIQQIVVSMHEKNGLPVYILFDRGPTSSFVTYAAVAVAGKPEDRVIEALSDANIRIALDKMYAVDAYFIDQFKLTDTSIFVPMLSAKSTMQSLMNAIYKGERQNRESYETTEVQEAARITYLKAAEIEKRLHIFSQIAENKVRLTKSQVAEYILNQIQPEVTERTGEVVDVAADFMLQPQLMDTYGVDHISKMPSAQKALEYLRDQ